ncbi:AfsR/SARP family transcriptional regulator [Phytohabitans rumicis]|nr:BTAD domain-containing putative transcriptional regulator [Phytohabitans rumicis]
MESLLCALALGRRQSASRDTLLDAVWPEGEPGRRTNQSLNTLVHDLRRILADALSGRSPVLRTDDGYRLNLAAGIAVDTVRFDHHIAAAADRLAAGDEVAALAHYEQAVMLYRGDLCSGGDLRLLIERERLRAQYLNTLAHLADHAFATRRYDTALRHAQQLLTYDPCREDAHRVVMRCFARLGQRSAGMQQYRLCRSVLREAFQAVPERATDELFDRLRLEPDRV